MRRMRRPLAALVSLVSLWKLQLLSEGFAQPHLCLRRRRLLDGCVGSLLFSQQARAEETTDLSQFIRFAEEAKTGWQINLPKDWITIRKEAAPSDASGAKSLLFSGGPTKKSEIKVLRASLGSSKSSTLDFFLSPQPAMTKDQAAEALSRSYAKKPSTFRFKLLKSKVLERGSGRILRYGFSVARCEGSQTESEGQKICVKPGSDDKLDTIARHWEVATTVTSTDGKEPYALWIVECSVPSENWKEESAQINQIVDSFAVGTKAQLDQLGS
ncbi:unnamed protein product [Cladocopium goreaui]|uniref:Pathogen-related protein n=1 Tax=Cladocopium goreaui TaxID=2562237 RepID=A0A9P1CP51_9DINO|nr:unnamed protein product [Cladocopium goreaui]